VKNKQVHLLGYEHVYLNGIPFKWAVAIADTPIFYTAAALCRRRFAADVVAVEADEMIRRQEKLG